MHERYRYGFFDLLGDLGGVKELITIVFGFFLGPISNFSFTISVAKKLFLVRTKDENMFLKKENEKEHVDSPKAIT